jgi:predicted AlkP superfamily pyrophosphatase or phosphodiesterase
MIKRNDIERQIRSHSLPGLSEVVVPPDYGGYSICGIPAFIRALFGEPVDRMEVFTPLLPEPLPQRVLFLLLDGMGYLHLNDLLASFPDLFLHRLIERGAFIPLTSTFPATTATALTSYNTGLTPQEHGMLGYRLYLKETSTITNMVRLSLLGSKDGDSALEGGIDIERFLSGPSLHDHLHRLGVESHVLLSKYIASSGLSRLLYNGNAKLHPVVDLSDMLVSARHILNRARGKTLLSLYWGATDAIAHTRGPWTEAFTAELRSIDAALERELAGAVDDTLLLISADHGFMAMEESDYLVIADYPELARNLLLPPVGDTRAAYLFVRDGKREEVRAFITDRFGDKLLCLDSRQALGAGLFGLGEVKPEVPDRIGDLVVISTGSQALYHPYRDSVKLKGMHGGLTPQEMLVPFIMSRL